LSSYTKVWDVVAPRQKASRVAERKKKRHRKQTFESARMGKCEQPPKTGKPRGSPEKASTLQLCVKRGKPGTAGKMWRNRVLTVHANSVRPSDIKRNSDANMPPDHVPNLKGFDVKPEKNEVFVLFLSRPSKSGGAAKHEGGT